MPTPVLPPHSVVSRALGMLLACLFATAAAADTPAPLVTDDGPYVFHVDGERLQSLWLCDGEVLSHTQRAARTATVKPRCGFPHPVVIPSRFADNETALPADARIVALSDIHGQYDLMVRLLRAHDVIDSRDRWRLGRDHLVITGDVFDRGPQVTETLWLLFRLQRQARAAGGAVHFLLGNHEAIVLYGDLRYIHPKYAEVARRLGRSYSALYGPDSVLGDWLRAQPVLLRLGDTLFLHGGIMPEQLDLALDVDATNAAYRASLGKPRAEVSANPDTARLYDGRISPIWYRGYFNGQLTTPEVQALTERLDIARIVVGHTTIGEVASFHAGHVIAIDSGIKDGESGQLLFIEGGQLSRGLLDGRREPLPERHAAPAGSY